MKKKLLVFLTSLVLTLLLLGGCIILVSYYMSKPEDEYSINSFIQIKNEKEALVSSCLELSDCLNESDQVELEINAGANEERNVKYELCFFVEYEQVPFFMEGREYTSYCFENSAQFTIQIEKKYFCMENNSFVVLLRQDVDRYAESSKLVRDTPPVILRYDLMQNGGKTKRKKDESLDITDELVDNMDDVIHIENQTGKEVTSCHIEKAGKLRLNALLGSTMREGEYTIFACFNSQQTMINGKKKMSVQKKQEGKLDLEISVPEQTGKYEFQLFFVPSPYEKISDQNFSEYNILASQKQTVYVE